MTNPHEDLELVRGSGNIFRDLGHPNAEVLQLKATLGAKIIGVLDDRKLTVRKAEEMTGIAASDLSRVRNAKLARFTVDRLIMMLAKLDQEIHIEVTTRAHRHTGKDDVTQALEAEAMRTNLHG